MNLNSVELKAFLPSRDYALSQQFYLDLGFTRASCDDQLSYFHHGSCSFLLQNFYQRDLAENLMMHLLVEDVRAWHARLCDIRLAETYSVRLSEVCEQPWGMWDFTLHDPSGVVWRIAQNKPD